MPSYAITLYQPWASLVVYGFKRIETRSWRTQYRGTLLIHASKNARYMPHLLVLLHRGAVPPEVGDIPYPIGAICGQVHLVHCAPTEWFGQGEHAIDATEQALGDYTPGRYGWVLHNAVVFPKPLPCQGRLGIWKVPDSVAIT